MSVPTFGIPISLLPIPNIYTPIWYLFLAVVGIYLERRTHWFSRFNVFTVFVVAMFVRYGIAVPFSDGINPASTTHTPISTGQLLSWYGALILTYIGIVLGVELVHRWGDKMPGRNLLAGLAATDTRALLIVTLALIALVGLVWIVLPWNDLADSVRAMLAPGHTAAQYRAHRVAYGGLTYYANSALNYAGSFSRFALLPCALWVLWFHRAQSLAIRVLFWITLGLLGVIGLVSGQKTPALLLILGFMIALVPGKDYYALLFGSVYYRETFEYSRVAQLRFIFYPALHPFLYGQSSFIISSFERVIGLASSVAQAPEVYIPTHTPGVGVGYSGTWNAGFFAEAWADFGFVGVIVEAIFVGAHLALIDRWYQAGPKGPLQMGTYATFCVSALYLTEVSLLTALWTFGLLSLFLVYLAFARFPLKARAIQAAPARPGR